MRYALPLVVLLAGVATAEEKKEKAPAPARVAVRATVAQFVVAQFGEDFDIQAAVNVDGLGRLSIDLGRTSQAAKEAREQVDQARKTGAGIVAEGKLRLEGDRLVLTADKFRAADAEKDRALPLGGVIVEGQAICGMCDLMKCSECTLAVTNGAAPVILDGKLAKRHAEGLGVIVATGKLRLQKDGLIRLDADKVEEKKK
jgi:hypothetical protein